jgi:Phage integrase family
VTSLLVTEPAAAPTLSATRPATALSPRPATTGSVARPQGVDWPATRQGRQETWERLTRPPFVLEGNPVGQGSRKRGLRLLLDWLETQPGATWQDRWLASGADAAGAAGAAGAAWRHVSAAWLREHDQDVPHRLEVLARALLVAISADIIRPSVRWLVTANLRRGALVGDLTRSRDAEGFAQLRALLAAEPNVPSANVNRTLYRAAQILAAKGGTLGQVTTGDVLELLEVEAAVHGTGVGGVHLFYRLLRTMGSFGDQAPATLRELRGRGQRTPEELIDRYRLACRPIRNLLVAYLTERQPALDYTSLNSLANILGKLFWADLERHHPGIDSLRLPAEVAQEWKQRLRTVTKTIRTPDGRQVEVAVDRINYHECLTPVRAFYLDLAQWALEDPARWGPWVAPCPIRAEEVSQHKTNRRRKARIDARTRERLPVLPVLVRSVDQQRKAAAELLAAAQTTPPGEGFTAAGETLVRVVSSRSSPGKVWAMDPATGTRRDLGREEDHAFWAWAAVEVLRATGVRVEELTELSHHSLVQYRLPTTGELVPLLQIAPSKTDAERLLLVSPELADVLSAVVRRVRAATGAVPLVVAYDPHERTWSPPSPLLFQRQVGAERRAITAASLRGMLTAALARTGLTDPATGGPLHFTPHDFRRVFITDAILNGLPPHIAQVIAGHHDINVTLGYKAVYPEEAIQAHRAFLARRRSLRPSEEYRTPTEQEWEEFLGHFERRKVSIGTCARAFATPCIHEHACVRCPLLWPDPAQRDRLTEIRDNLLARIAEAEREGWLGEVEGLQVSLAGANDKLAQLARRVGNQTTVDLGIPTVPRKPSPETARGLPGTDHA